jgi:hypothetical protein
MVYELRRPQTGKVNEPFLRKRWSASDHRS